MRSQHKISEEQLNTPEVFLYLPPEIWNLILSFLNTKNDIIKLCHVSEYFYCNFTQSTYISICQPKENLFTSFSNLFNPPEPLTFSTFTNLTKLNITNCNNTKEILSNFTNLSKLGIFKCYVTDKDMSHLSNLTTLTKLNISENEHITDEGLSHLSNLTNLIVIKFNIHKDDCSIDPVIVTNKGLLHLSNLTNLTKLNIGFHDPKMEKAHSLVEIKACDSYYMELPYLSNLTNLTVLNIKCCEITDLSPLSSLTKLNRCNISHCYITDSHLSNVSNIKTLNMEGCYNEYGRLL